MKTTAKQRKALQILADHPDITARAFGDFYFTEPEHEYLYTASSNQGYGACRGKKLWLCAGSLLGRLVAKEWVRRRIDREGRISFVLTYEGEKVLKNA